MLSFWLCKKTKESAKIVFLLYSVSIWASYFWRSGLIISCFIMSELQWAFHHSFLSYCIFNCGIRPTSLLITKNKHDHHHCFQNQWIISPLLLERSSHAFQASTRIIADVQNHKLLWLTSKISIDDDWSNLLLMLLETSEGSHIPIVNDQPPADRGRKRQEQ